MCISSKNYLLTFNGHAMFHFNFHIPFQYSVENWALILGMHFQQYLEYFQATVIV